MKKQLKKLNALEINLDLFYNISFINREIRLQGTLTEESLIECEKLFKLKLAPIMDWICGTKDGITITLTK